MASIIDNFVMPQTFSGFMQTEIPKQYSHHDLITITSEFSNLLGAGTFGKVYKGELPNGMQVAVKVLKENDIKETFMAEARTMFTASHKNLVKLYGFCFDRNMKALVYECMAGSLDMILYENDPDVEKGNKFPKIEWTKLYDIAVGVAEGISYLHDGCYQQIIHHDVKPANVLLDLNFWPKLTDFGLAKHMSRDLSHFTMTMRRGTPGYAAPEIGMPLSRTTYTCDVYSYGKMLFEILARKRNIPNQDEDEEFPEQVWKMYVDGRLDEMIMNCGIKRNDIEKARTLTMVGFWCIQFTPEARPTMRTVINWLEKAILVPKPSNPFFAARASLVPTPYDRMSMNWWSLLPCW